MKGDIANIFDFPSVVESFDIISKNPGNVSVFGSMNIDYSIRTERLPQAGETIMGGPIHVFSGGKSGNQAVAASLIGGHVTMFGCIGNDANGDFLLRKLSKAGINISGIKRTDKPSGSTLITVDDAGENTIVYSPGANSLLSTTYVQSIYSKIVTSSILGLCLESPINAVQEVAILCHQAGMKVLLNNSPFKACLPSSLIDACDILLINEHELAQLLNIPDKINPSSDWGSISNKLENRGFKCVIVTLGSNGSVVIDLDGVEYIEALHVHTTDTTGCGDAYMGAILVGLASGVSLSNSAKMATVVSAYAAMSFGAQSSYGTATKIKEAFHL